MKKVEEQIIKGFKGFDSELKCRDKQYKVGKTHKEDVTPDPCNAGMHFCESPLYVFRYYEPNRSRYCTVEGRGKISKCNDKIACTKLRVKAEIGLSGIIQAGVKFNLEKVEWADKAHTEGRRSGALATGYQSQIIKSLLKENRHNKIVSNEYFIKEYNKTLKQAFTEDLRKLEL